MDTDNFRLESMKRITNKELAIDFINKKIKELKLEIGNDQVLLALSGGVDSSVTAKLLIDAIGKNLTCIHVNHGLLRKNEAEQVIEVFKNKFNANLIYVDATDRFLNKLENVSDPETKRKIIGNEFIEVFNDEVKKLCANGSNIKFLAQGTIYPDILESNGIKAHHNVGGLPKELDFKLIEPIKLLYKDEVRIVGNALGLPDNMVYRQPFPGPGLGVRCIGAITRDRLEALRKADFIVREEIEKLPELPWQYFALIPDFKSTGVKNNKRYEGWALIIRCVNTIDAVTATVPNIPYETLHTIVSRIISEVDGINRVLYDLSPKPIATIEWE